MPFPFAFAWLNANKAVGHSCSLSDPVLCEVTQANQRLTAFKNIIWTAMKRKELNAMTALLSILMLLAIYPLASKTNASQL